MPNQRARTKIYLGGFVEREFKDRLWEIAREAGVETNQFGFALGAIRELLKKRRSTRAIHSQSKIVPPKRDLLLPAVMQSAQSVRMAPRVQPVLPPPPAC